MKEITHRTKINSVNRLVEAKDIHGIIKLSTELGGLDIPCASNGETLLSIVDDIDILSVLLNEFPSTNVNALHHPFGRTALADAMTKFDIDKVEFLLAHGADVSDRTNNERMRNIFLCGKATEKERGDKEKCLRVFLEHTEDPLLSDGEDPPGFIALYNSDYPTAATFFEHDHRSLFKSKHYTPERIISEKMAAMNDSESLGRFISLFCLNGLEHLIESTLTYKKVPLIDKFIACAQRDCMEVMLDIGFIPTRDPFVTAFNSDIVFDTEIPVFFSLLNRGFPLAPDLCSKLRLSPLPYSLLKLFVEHGVDIHEKDMDGYSLFDVAIKNNKSDFRNSDVASFEASVQDKLLSQKFSKDVPKKSRIV